MELSSRGRSPPHSSWNALINLNLPELIEHDSRPTFILDAARPDLGTCPLYKNLAFNAIPPQNLLDVIIGDDHADDHDREISESLKQFKSWIGGRGSSTDKLFVFCEHNWQRCVIADRWNVISGSPAKVSPYIGRTIDSESTSSKPTPPRRSTFDWTDDVPMAILSPHVAWARSIDWANTALGSMRSWSAELRCSASLIMQDTRPAVGFYGPEVIMIYNQAYTELLGNLHPCMGCSARTVFTTWDEHFEPTIERNLAGETIINDNMDFPMTRNGYLEETYFSNKWIPLFDSEGVTIGHYVPCVETVSNSCTLFRRLQVV